MSDSSRPGETGTSIGGPTAEATGLGVVGHYAITGEIGRGGAAIVYLARQLDLDRLVALKELRVSSSRPEDFARRFLRESRVAGSLSHPNIVTVYEYFEHDGRPYIVMEYLERGSLRPYVGTLGPAALAGVLEGVLAALTCAETGSIVHRDLKPENIMVTGEGRVKLTDFGIAKATQKVGADQFETTVGMTVGTPSYMAPEQALGEPVGPWTDLYSVGIMTWEHLVGHVPFSDTASTPTAVLLRHVNEQIPPPITERPDVDPALSAWVERLVASRPDDRFQTAADAWDALEQIVVAQLGPLWRRESRLKEEDSRRSPAVQTMELADQFGAYPVIGNPAADADYHTLEPQSQPSRPPDVSEATPVAESDAAAAAAAEPVMGPDSALAAGGAVAADPEGGPGLDPDAYHTYLDEPVLVPAAAEPQLEPTAPRVVRNLVLRPQTVRMRPGERVEVSATLDGDPIAGAEWALAGGASSFATARATAAGAVIQLHPGPGEPPWSSSLEVRCLERGASAAVANATVEILPEEVTGPPRPAVPAEPASRAPATAPARAPVSGPASWRTLVLLVALAGCLLIIAALCVSALAYLVDTDQQKLSLLKSTNGTQATPLHAYNTFTPLVALAGVALLLVLVSLVWRKRLFTVGAALAGLAFIGYSVHVHSLSPGSDPAHYSTGFTLSIVGAAVVVLAAGAASFARSH
jgi:serine/threonine protein kinase